MSKLVIVESPAKAKTIGKYLGPDFVVKASMGHLRDLPKKKIGVDIENDFAPVYEPIEGKDKIIAELRKAAKESDFVYLATDPDREGEAISWHLKQLLKLKDKDTQRITFNEITKPAVKYGIEHPRDIDQERVDAQQARRILDRIVGYQLSPFLWRKVKRGISAGRVQSVATRIVVDREEEIRAFVPEEYWTIEANLKTQLGGAFVARFHGDINGKLELKTELDAMTIVESVAEAEFKVATLKKGKKKRTPPPPFTTSTLQQEASRKLGMIPRSTMSVAQQLYEGIEIDGLGLTGLITYMRTDSLRLSDEATAAAAQFIRSRYGNAYHTGAPRAYKAKGASQDAHEAIRPSDVNLVPEDIRKSLTPDQYKLYKLIWSRFVACQMADCLMDTISADIQAYDYIFRASGHTVTFSGFTAVYEEGTDSEKSGESGKPLPAFAEGDVMEAKSIDPAQHFTQPPARYTEASLIRAMEEKGIGRPSTYAPTITTILSRNYVVKENRSLRPTPLGEGVTGLLVDKFTSVANYEFTANMEEQLDEVEAGKLTYLDVLRQFYDGFDGALKQAEIDMEKTRIKIQDEVSDVICDQCGKNMVIKIGRFGKFLACPGFPECTNTKAIAEDTGAACPICGSKVGKRKSGRGYVYFTCENYSAAAANGEEGAKGCTFITWDKPQKEKCPVCDNALFRHTDRDSKEVIDLCLREGCGYKELVKEGVSAEQAEINRKRREERAEKAKAREEAKLAAQAAGEEEKPKRKTATKKTTTAKKTTTKKATTTKKTTTAKKATATKKTATAKKTTTAKKATTKKAKTEE